MRVGVLFPQTELGPDPSVVPEFAQAVDAAGYDHLVAFDHVLGADAERHPGWSGTYGIEDEFYEPMVLFGYLAACTRLGLLTGILVLPQRQTALVAKQAATIDVLSGGRLRLGVGLGWNPVEYAALGRSFAARGAQLDQQIPLLQRLWSDPVVDGDGPSDERIVGAGIAPLPIQRPIPVWIGCGPNPRALERVGRLAQGFIPRPELPPGPALTAAWDVIRKAAERAGRDPEAIGLQGTLRLSEHATESELERHAEEWRAAGATHLAVSTIRTGLRGREHVEAAVRIAAHLAIDDPDRVGAEGIQ